ncbi:MAG: hypothetical protein QOF11_1707 [Chloroflexota bacterium]|jgi:hypothetical protein|nr:hypothetical protein [Chloroflexota bacterium]
MTAVRLFFRSFRVEILILGMVLGSLAVVVGWMAVRLAGLDLGSCADPAVSDCASRIAEGNALVAPADTLVFGTSVLTAAAALLLAVPLVAREIEHGTAPLAWTVFPTRAGWLWPRIAVGLVVVIILAGVPAFAVDWFDRAREIPPVPGGSLRDHDLRGLPVVGRAALCFAIGLLVGARFGKVLPSLLIGLVVAGVAVGGLTAAHDAWLRSEAVPVGEQGALYLGQAWRDRSGQIVDEAEAESREAYGTPGFAAEYTFVALGIPASRAGEVISRETALDLLVAAVVLGFAAAIVGRRRPT